MFCSVLSSSTIFCVRIVLVIIRISQIRHKNFSNRGHGRGHRHHKNVGLSESVWSKKTDHVQVADGIKLDCDTVSAVGIKVKVDGHCTF